MTEPLDTDAIRDKLSRLDETEYRLHWLADALGTTVGALLDALDEARAKAVDGGEWVTDYGHDPGRPTVHGIEWHPGLHCIRDTYQRRVWYGPVEPVTDDEDAP